MSGDSSTLKTLSGLNDADDVAGAGAAGSSAGAAAAGASASAGASDSVASARRGFTALGVLNTKPEHAAIERIKAVARIFAAVVCCVCLVCRRFLADCCRKCVGSVYILRRLRRPIASGCAAFRQRSQQVIKICGELVSRQSGRAKTAPDAYKPLVQTSLRKFCRSVDRR